MKREIDITNGFTLIELLIVVLIIAILTSILLPCLNRVRDVARRLGCSSNLKQLTVAWQAYAYDNQNELCSPSTNFNTHNYSQLSDTMKKFYYSSPQNWVCSGRIAKLNTIAKTGKAFWGGEGILEIDPGSDVPAGTYHIETEAGAIWNYLEEINVYKCKRDKTDMLISYSMSEIMGTDYKKISEIYESSEKAVFIDAQPKSRKWLTGPFRLITDLSSRHNGGCNLSFVDGHCEYRKHNRKTKQYLQGEIEKEDFAEDNDDYDYFTTILKKGKTYR